MDASGPESMSASIRSYPAHQREAVIRRRLSEPAVLDPRTGGCISWGIGTWAAADAPKLVRRETNTQVSRTLIPEEEA